MKNIKTEVKGNTLTITIDLKGKQWASASGKTSMIASTEGNTTVDGTDGMKLGLNAYFPKG